MVGSNKGINDSDHPIVIKITSKDSRKTLSP